MDNPKRTDVLSTLPLPIILDILSRLQVAQVAACRVISKEIYKAIATDYFYSLTSITHPNQQVLTFGGDDNTHCFRVLELTPFDREEIGEDVEAVICKKIKPAELLERYLKDEYEEALKEQCDGLRSDLDLSSIDMSEGYLNDVVMLGSSRGVVCLRINNSGYIIWNPTIGKAIEFAPPPPEMLEVLCSGFAYVGPDETFEVVAVGVNEKSSHKLIACILSTSTQQWSVVSGAEIDFGGEIHVVKNGGVAGDLLVWQYRKLGEGSEVIKVIQGFSATSHEFVRIPSPSLEDGFELCVAAGKLIAWVWDVNDIFQVQTYNNINGRWDCFFSSSELVAQCKTIFDEDAEVVSILGSTNCFRGFLFRLLSDHLVVGPVRELSDARLFHVGDEGQNVTDLPEKSMEFSSVEAVGYEEACVWPFPDYLGHRQNAREEALIERES